MSTGKTVAAWEHEEPVFAATFSPDGKTAATGGHKWIKIWDVATGKSIEIIEKENVVNYVAFSPYGKFLAATISAGRLKAETHLLNLASKSTVAVLKRTRRHGRHGSLQPGRKIAGLGGRG